MYFKSPLYAKLFSFEFISQKTNFFVHLALYKALKTPASSAETPTCSATLQANRKIHTSRLKTENLLIKI